LMMARDADTNELLRRELVIANVAWSKFLPSWANGFGLDDPIVNELAVAINAPIHEGHIPPYAALIVEDVSRLQLLPLAPDHITLARQSADGRSTATVFERDRFVGLLTLDASIDPDLSLARLATLTGGVAFHRSDQGHVRAYSPNGALRNIGRQWTRSPSIQEAAETVTTVAPEVDEETLGNLLEFAYLILSPRHIGATLVWLLTDTNPFTGGSAVDLTPLQLTTQRKSAARLLSFADHLLAQYDGATIVSRDGTLTAVGVQLRASEDAMKFVRPLAGTRHTSAKRASFDHGDTLVITVSSDGPVTVFSDGVSIFELKWFSAEDITTALHKSDLQLSYEGQHSCRSCGKISDVEAMFDPSAEGHYRSVKCPVCDNVLWGMECLEIRATVRKIMSTSPG
jgi:DNA integrity scanning protein DisA with diadenylate cyclase activity